MFWQVGGGQTGGGVFGHEGTQVRRDADGATSLGGIGGSDDAPNALGVASLVDRQKRDQVIAGAGVHEVDAGEIPSGDAEAQLQEGLRYAAGTSKRTPRHRR